MTLVRDDVVALYQQIADTLRVEIDRGDYQPSGRLPSEPRLCERFGVSRVTVRQALTLLAEQGVIDRKQGKGSYARGRQVRHGLDALRSFHEALLLAGLKPRMHLQTLQYQDTPDHLRTLFSQPRCLYIERLHTVDGEPIALGRHYLKLPEHSLTREQVEAVPAYALLASVTGQHVARADLAIRANQADAALARTLDVKRGTALLVMTRTSWLGDGQCCDSSCFHIRPERYEFVISSVYPVTRQRQR